VGHLPIVNKNTLQNLIKQGCLSTRGNIGIYLEKTVADLFSSVLAMRPGNYVFPWEVSLNRNKKGRGFFGIFKVAKKKTYFVKGDDFPIRTDLELLECYPNPVSEDIALDLFRTDLLWNAIGKKSLGRGRSVTHQTISEDQIMSQLIQQANPDGSMQLEDFNSLAKPTGITITIDISQNTDNIPDETRNLPKDEKLKSIDIENIQWVKDTFFKYEKVLEAWLMEHIDDTRSQFAGLIFPPDSLVWFGNYLSYGVLGGNIDIVTKNRIDDEDRIFVIELKKDALGASKWKNAIDEVKKYSEMLSKVLSNGEKSLVTPVVIAHSGKAPNSDVRDCASNGWETSGIKLAGYRVEAKEVIFSLFQ